MACLRGSIHSVEIVQGDGFIMLYDKLIKGGLAATAVGAMALAGATGAFAKMEGDTVIIGSAISLTGKYSTAGIHTKNGYDLAVKKINEAGGVKIGGKSYKLVVKYYDDESTPLRTAQLTERLIQQDGVKMMLGPYSSATTVAMAPVAEKYKIPMVEAEGATRSLFNKGYKYVFAVLSTSEQYLAPAVDVAAEIAVKNGKKASSVRVAMAFENDPFSLDVRAGVVDMVKKHGMKIVIDDKLPRDLNDMSATLTKIRALKPDLLVVSGHSKGAATAVRQMKELKITTPLVAMTHCEAAKVVKNFGKAASEGLLCPTQWGETLSYKDGLFGTAMQYDKLFKETYKGYRNVPYQAAQASAAVQVFKDAIERAGSVDPKKVRDALASTEMQTFYGNIKFAPEGNNIAKPMVLRQIQDGKFKIVAPTKWASDPVQYPRKAGM
jgi:branched-chain amino acid transport system substrate-binding protein